MYKCAHEETFQYCSANLSWCLGAFNFVLRCKRRLRNDREDWDWWCGWCRYNNEKQSDFSAESCTGSPEVFARIIAVNGAFVADAMEQVRTRRCVAVSIAAGAGWSVCLQRVEWMLVNTGWRRDVRDQRAIISELCWVLETTANGHSKPVLRPVQKLHLLACVRNNCACLNYTQEYKLIWTVRICDASSHVNHDCDARLCRASYSNKLWYKMFY